MWLRQPKLIPSGRFDGVQRSWVAVPEKWFMPDMPLSVREFLRLEPILVRQGFSIAMRPDPTKRLH